MPTPEEYIERAYKVAKKNNCKVKLSITDHQSIEGSKRAIKYLKEHPQYADYVEIVSGIEINTSLGSVNNELGVSKKNGFAGCHILGYNYNLLDPELSAFSYLNYAETENSKCLGLKLIAARNMISNGSNIFFLDVEGEYAKLCRQLRW